MKLAYMVTALLLVSFLIIPEFSCSSDPPMPHVIWGVVTTNTGTRLNVVNITLVNNRTNNVLYNVSYNDLLTGNGAYIFNIGNFKDGWEDNDSLVMTATKEGYRPHTTMVVVNASKGSQQFDITLNPLSHNVPPIVVITYPANNTIVSGIALISGTARDSNGNSTITSVELKIDAGGWQYTKGTTTWSYFFNSTGVSNDPHTVSVRCFDGVLYSALKTLTITVNNTVQHHPPHITITSPKNGSTLSATTSVRGVAWDDEGNTTIVSVELQIDDEEWHQAVGTLHWNYTLDTTTYPDGTHTISVRCIDYHANYNSTSIQIDIKNKEKGTPGFETIALIGAILFMVGIGGQFATRKRSV